MGLGMVFAAWKITQSQPSRQDQPQPSAAGSGTPAPAPDYTKQRKQFFKREIEPLIAAEDARNRKAIERAEARLSEIFDGYSANVPHFAEALTEWGTKYQITKAMVHDWRAKTDTARIVPARLFAEKVVSDEKLDADIHAIVAGLENDFAASRDQMLSEATQRLKTADFPVPALNAPDRRLSTVFTAELAGLLAERGKQSPAVTLLGFGGGWLAEEAVKNFVRQVIRMLAVRMGAVAAGAGGATASGAVAGGAAGTVAEPGGGTVIGLAAGVVVGMVVDWWMESRFKEKIVRESRGMLEKMRTELWSDSAGGLAFRFNQLADTSRECHGEALKTIITGIAK